MEPELREAHITDGEAINEVKRRNGLTTEPWAWLWRDNPALAAFSSGIPPGWVLERAGLTVGYLGNVPLRYSYGGRTVTVAAARGFAVDPAFRSHSIRLAAAFLSQTKAQLLLNTSANVPTSRIFGALRAQKIPQPDYDRALFWVLRPAGFLSSVFRRLGRRPAVARGAGWMLAPALRAEMILKRRTPPAGDGAIQVERVPPQQAGEEFDEFWQRTLSERPACLLAERSRAALRWRYGHPAAVARRAVILAARRAGRVAGYAVVTREDSPDIGLDRSRVVDLIAERDDAGVVDRLLGAAHEHARADGSHVLEVIGFPAGIRQRLGASHPYVRQLPSWQFWYKAVDPALAPALARAEGWYGNSYDGDASL